MTTEEAIKILKNRECCIVHSPFLPDDYDYNCAECDKAYDMAYAALRGQYKRENPKPLTLDELREMVQNCEGVYVANCDGTPVFRGQRYCAAVLDWSTSFGSTKMHVQAIYGNRLSLWEDEYGVTWLAYRHKPKEEDTNERMDQR